MRIVIVGAGVTGLACAWKLSKDNEVVLLEKRPSIGGIARTFEHEGFKLDSGPHKIYSLVPGILDEMRNLLGDEAATIPKTSGVIIGGKRLDYPIRFFDLLTGLGLVQSFKLAFGYGIAIFLSPIKKRSIKSYEDYFKVYFGGPAYEMVFRPIAQKSWGDPKKLAAEVAQRRVPYNGVFKLIKSMLFKDKSLSAENFYYPKKGFIELSDIMLQKTLKNNGNIIYSAEVQKFHVEDNKINGVTFMHQGHLKKMNADYVISTATISMLPSLFNATPEVATAAQKLKFRSLLLVYVIIDKPKVMQDVWTFVPDPTFIFQRISEQKNFSNQMGPEGKTVLTCEVMCDYNDKDWNTDDETMYKRVITDLVKAGFIAQGMAKGFFVLKLKNIYPIYDLGYKQNLETVLNYTDQYENFITLGRLGLFNYNNSDHCIDMAIWAANHIRSGKSIKEWVQTRKRFDDYVIVD